ncbi:hypothetical protein KEM56_001555 [Ascosphaera pollenicola]|nr:hypothetical protein KEM56_001555 [Ascosphaera pollenicola]
MPATTTHPLFEELKRGYANRRRMFMRTITSREFYENPDPTLGIDSTVYEHTGRQSYWVIPSNLHWADYHMIEGLLYPDQRLQKNKMVASSRPKSNDPPPIANEDDKDPEDVSDDTKTDDQPPKLVLIPIGNINLLTRYEQRILRKARAKRIYPAESVIPNVKRAKRSSSSRANEPGNDENQLPNDENGFTSSGSRQGRRRQMNRTPRRNLSDHDVSLPPVNPRVHDTDSMQRRLLRNIRRIVDASLANGFGGDPEVTRRLRMRRIFEAMVHNGEFHYPNDVIRLEVERLDQEDARPRVYWMGREVRNAPLSWILSHSYGGPPGTN